MIVFPMAGLSERFAKAGYSLPKYRLEAGSATIFSHVVRSFERYFSTEDFLFICRDIADTPAFIEAECANMGITATRTVILDHTTRGQAETVYLGLQQAAIDADASLTVFNIDTIRPDFRYPDQNIMQGIDGYLEVFKSAGENWSFARTRSATDMTVLETAEKKRISDLCSTGLYYFTRMAYFTAAFEKESRKPAEQWTNRELYIAPLYNALIERGARIIAIEVPSTQIIPCGVPEEYESLKRSLEVVLP